VPASARPPDTSPFDELPKVRSEVTKGKESGLLADHAGQRKSTEVEDGAEISGIAEHPTRVEPPAPKPPRRAGLERLQEIFMTEDLLDAGEVAALIARFPKVSGTLILLGDGTLMGGNLPKEFRPDAALLAPKVLKTVREFGNRLKSRDPSAVTIFLDQPLSLCCAGDVCILVAHEGRGLLPGMRERICEIAKALDMLYERETDSGLSGPSLKL